MQVAVCGPARCSEEESRAAYAIGRDLAQRGVTVLCGGGSGVMAAVAAGARSAGGVVVGIHPGPAPRQAVASATPVNDFGQVTEVDAGEVAVEERHRTEVAVGEVAEVSVAITTNLGQARNAVLVASADAVIVVGGSWGTLSELALAMRRAQEVSQASMRVVSLHGWQVLDQAGQPVGGYLSARDPRHAVLLALGG
ncbi:MAG TPA: dethiobiotin synthetase [Micromonosporaceae bacterium]